MGGRGALGQVVLSRVVSISTPRGTREKKRRRRRRKDEKSHHTVPVAVSISKQGSSSSDTENVWAFATSGLLVSLSPV